MDLDLAADLRASPERAFPVVADLGSYPQWLGIVRRAEPAFGADGAPSWSVEIEGGVGPLRRRKTLRMVRTVHEAPNRVRFERDERDGREHPAWVLTAELTPGRLCVHLHYAGVPPLPGLDLLLRREASASARRLDRLLGV